MVDYKPIIQYLDLPFHYHVDVLRLDLLHPEISGNKWFKLKKNLEKAAGQNQKTIITFGGAHSNHIAATAAACKMFGLKSTGIIRGEGPREWNETLLNAQQNGMQLHFTTREFYKQKYSAHMQHYLVENFGEHYLVPEGGNNTEGALGCMEILDKSWDYNYVLCACGTGTTYAGLLLSAKPAQTIIGINVLKGYNTLVQETEEFIKSNFEPTSISIQSNSELENEFILRSCITDKYCFSGYAKYDEELVEFKKQFESAHALPIDYVYTAKLFYGLTDLCKKNKFKSGSRVLVLHSGGLQGNRGFEKRYKLNC